MDATPEIEVKPKRARKKPLQVVQPHVDDRIGVPSFKTQLDEYTPSDIHNSMNMVLNAVSGLHEKMDALSTSLTTVVSDVHLIKETQARQGKEIWDPDGSSRIGNLKGELSKQALQIRGLWATLGMIVGFIGSQLLPHLIHIGPKGP